MKGRVRVRMLGLGLWLGLPCRRVVRNRIEKETRQSKYRWKIFACDKNGVGSKCRVRVRGLGLGLGFEFGS